MENISEHITAFKKCLWEEEKQSATVEKYLRDVRAFCEFAGVTNISKELVIAYKSELSQKFKPAGVNSRLVAINRFLASIGHRDCCVKLLKVQRQIFANEDTELTTSEYKRLINAAGKSRISYILQTICGTGIRVSELKYVTVEAVMQGKAVVNCKGKMRVIFFPTYFIRRRVEIFIGFLEHFAGADFLRAVLFAFSAAYVQDDKVQKSAVFAKK